MVKSIFFLMNMARFMLDFIGSTVNYQYSELRGERKYAMIMQ